MQYYIELKYKKYLFWKRKLRKSGSTNYYIKVYNKFVLDYKKTILKADEIKYYFSESLEQLQFYESTLSSNVDSALWFLQFSIDCMKRYGKEYLPEKKIISEKIETSYDNLMPSKNFIENYARNIERIMGAV